jgi:ATP-dependent Clp protease ATP-binding subunit ClpX
VAKPNANRFADEIDNQRKSDNLLLPEMFLAKVAQQALLKLFRRYIKCSTKGGRKHPDQKFVEVNTQNILFIAGGAFDGIEKLFQKN